MHSRVRMSMLLWLALAGWCGAQRRRAGISPCSTCRSELGLSVDQQNSLVPVTFERAETPLHPDQTARATKFSYVELKGEHSTTVRQGSADLSIYCGTRRRASAFDRLAHAAPRRARRATAIAQQGMAGFAIASDQIVKPFARGLVKDGDQVFMELRPRVSLMPGEYAIILVTT